jgi:hypothetical protein
MVRVGGEGEDWGGGVVFKASLSIFFIDGRRFLLLFVFGGEVA